MQTLTEIKQLLESHGLAPDKALGQNFLCDHNLIRRLVDESGIRAGDLVLEVGPGTGALTDELIERGGEVIACEIDRGLASLLRGRFADRITLIEGDALHAKHELNPAITAAISRRDFKLVANLPYGVASPLMVILATQYPPTSSDSPVPAPSCLGQFVTIQKEVGERLRAKPGTDDYSEISVLVQAMCIVRRVAVLPPECFWPRPKVTSEMVSIVPRSLAGETPLTSDPARLAAACRLLFGRRRKQIGSILGRETIERLTPLPAGIEATSRAETLSIEQLEALAVQFGTIGIV